LRNERHEQDRDGRDSNELPSWAQAQAVAERRRLPHAEDEDEGCKQKPPRVEEAQSEQDGDRGPGQVELAAPEERPRDVAPVQLPCRQEIDRGHEEPDPAREGERVRMGEERLRKREEQREAAEQERRLRLPREREAGR